MHEIPFRISTEHLNDIKRNSENTLPALIVWSISYSFVQWETEHNLINELHQFTFIYLNNDFPFEMKCGTTIIIQFGKNLMNW